MSRRRTFRRIINQIGMAIGIIRIGSGMAVAAAGREERTFFSGAPLSSTCVGRFYLSLTPRYGGLLDRRFGQGACAFVRFGLALSGP